MGGKQKKTLRALVCSAIVTLALAAGAVSEANAIVDSNSPLPYCGDANHPYPVGDLNQDCWG